MRLLRLGALFGSLMLLSATSVSLLSRRSDLKVEQEYRVTSAVSSTWGAVASTIDGAMTTTAVARQAADGVTGDNASASLEAIATQLATIADDASACVGVGSTECTDEDLTSIAAVGALVDRLDGVTPESIVDPDTQSMYVAARSPSTGALAVVRIPITSLLPDFERSDDVSLTIAAAPDAAGAISLVEDQHDGASIDEGSMGIDGAGEPFVADGQRVAVAVIAATFSSGALVITGDTDAKFGLAGSATGSFILLLLLGTVLLALAAWTFLAERRALERQANTDELTGLVNRREFERMSAEAIDTAARFQNGLCVMLLDLNGFKQVNDTLGHQYGDLVLKAVSERLGEVVRDSDIVGRWGGDEFVVLLPGLSERSAVRASAERIYAGLIASPLVGDTTLGASIGAAIYPRHGTDLDSLIRSADVAMYGAKSSGVSHRIADTLTAGDALLGSRIAESPAVTREISTGNYVGPDRRVPPPPPPPPPPPEFIAVEGVVPSPLVGDADRVVGAEMLEPPSWPGSDVVEPAAAPAPKAAPTRRRRRRRRDHLLGLDDAATDDLDSIEVDVDAFDIDDVGSTEDVASNVDVGVAEADDGAAIANADGADEADATDADDGTVASESANAR